VIYFPLNGSYGSTGAVLNLDSVPVSNTSSRSHIILAGTYRCTSATRTNTINNIFLLSICFSSFEYPVIGSEETCTDRHEHDPPHHKSQIRIKKPANHQRCYDQ